MCLGICAPLQLYLLHATLAGSPVGLAVPMYQAMMILMTISAGGVFFDEFASISPSALSGFILGALSLAWEDGRDEGGGQAGQEGRRHNREGGLRFESCISDMQAWRRRRLVLCYYRGTPRTMHHHQSLFLHPTWKWTPKWTPYYRKHHLSASSGGRWP